MSGATFLSPLFVPSFDLRKVRRALASGADAVILDLEDGVPPDSKRAARAVVQEVLAARSGQSPGPAVWVRVNAASTDDFSADVAGVDWRAVDAAVLSKAEHPAAIAALEAAGAREIVPLIESVTGLRGLRALCSASPRVRRAALGALDLILDLELTHVPEADDSELIWHVRRELVLESRCLGLAPPLDGVFTRLGDLAGLKAVCDRARTVGFAGKLLIHPEQIPVAHACFTADALLASEARALLDAVDAKGDGQSPVRIGDRMVDAPVVKRARAVVSAAQGGSEDDAR